LKVSKETKASVMHIQTSDQGSLSLGIGNYSCNWGTHICGLYENEKERDEILFGFLKQGYHDGDLQLYCPTERTKDDFLHKFSNHCPECVSHLSDKECFRVLAAKDLYYPDGVFSPFAMDEGLNAFYKSSQKSGPTNIRATAEMVWALEAIPGIEYLMAYEARLNYFIPGKPWISICMYNVTRFSGSTILNVLQIHPFVINGGIITQNPHYIHPDVWLTEHAPQFLD